ncbi:MAG: hypothetical protein JST09_03380 [Bacteroidetes bacterium]|nr:hypothetical protein [Bacteroidota bacterium]
MRRYLLFSCLLVLSNCLYAQVMTIGDFIKAPNVSRQKFNNYLSREGFFRSNEYINGDTLIQEYQLKEKKIATIADSANRYAQGLFYENKTAFCYYTTSTNECKEIIRALKDNGFHCEGENYQAPFLYQKNDMTVKLSSKVEDTLVYYSFIVLKDVLPAPKNIAFAEDFLGFNSHENLEYVFGKGNVQKDVYYFSDTDVVRCSILFPNTDRQVIFIWKDELNRRSVSHLLIGNSLRNKKSGKEDRPFSENVWTLRNGLRANMSLSELVRMNNADFSFYGLKSQYAGIVVPDKKGNIDFKNTGVILSCLNCSNSKLMKQETVSAGEAIENSERVFVLALIVMPQKEYNWTAFHR